MDDQTPEKTATINDNAPTSPPELSPRHQGFIALRTQGFNQAETARMLGYSKANATHLEHKLKPKDDLTTSSMVRLASKAHKIILGSFVNPDKIQSPIELKGADVSKAIDRVYDRVQPVKREESGPSHVTFISINLDGCK